MRTRKMDIRDVVVWKTEVPGSADRGLTYRQLSQQSTTGELRDNQNPIFLFSLASTGLLLDIVKGKVNCRMLAKIALVLGGYRFEKKWK